MATIASFRKSVSELSQEDLLERIIQLRTERRMIPEKVERASKKKSAAKQPKQITIADYMDNLDGDEKKAMLANLMKLKRGC